MEYTVNFKLDAEELKSAIHLVNRSLKVLDRPVEFCHSVPCWKVEVNPLSTTRANDIMIRCKPAERLMDLVLATGASEINRSV
jgi:hypothetical protein